LKVLISLADRLATCRLGYCCRAPAGRAALASSWHRFIYRTATSPPAFERPAVVTASISTGVSHRRRQAELHRPVERVPRPTRRAVEDQAKIYLSFDSPAGPQNYANIGSESRAEQVDFLTIDGYDLATPADSKPMRLHLFMLRPPILRLRRAQHRCKP